MLLANGATFNSITTKLNDLIAFLLDVIVDYIHFIFLFLDFFQLY